MALPTAAAMPNQTPRTCSSLPRFCVASLCGLEDVSAVVENRVPGEFQEPPAVLAASEFASRIEVRTTWQECAASSGLRGASVESEQLPLYVSVVIPCLNEANSIGYCVEKAIAALQAAGLRGEVVMSDNGSTDGSIELAEKLGARVVQAEQKGYGAALQAGIRASRGQFVVMGDADDSYDFSEVPRFVEAWRKGFDVVMGNRFRGEIKPGAMPWHHKYIGNPILSGVLNVLF